MHQPAVDIVLATNRVGRYLSQTLQSVREQSYGNWRLVVVDDGTPDPAAVPRAVEGMDALVVRQPNRGLPAARNRGIAEGTAPLIALLDDDDLWAPDKLAAQVAALEASPDAVASFTAGRYIDGDGNEFGEGWPAEPEPSRRFVSGEVPAPRIVTLMVRRTAHDAIGGFNETYSLAEDNEYILRMAIHGEMEAVPRPLVAYRRHDSNMSSADSLEGRIANRRLLDERLAAHGADPEIRSLLLAHKARFEGAGAQECVRAAAAAVRRRDARRLWGELGWAAGAPVQTARSLARALRPTSASAPGHDSSSVPR